MAGFNEINIADSRLLNEGACQRKVHDGTRAMTTDCTQQAGAQSGSFVGQ